MEMPGPAVADAAVSVYAPSQDRNAPGSKFDLADFKSDALSTKFLKWIFAYPQVQILFGLLRRFLPIVKVPGLNHVLVTRFEDVQEVLKHDQVFAVPFGDKVKGLNGGPNFLLGMQNDADYRRYHRQVTEAFMLEDVPKLVAPLSARLTDEIIAGCRGRIDAIQDLMTLVPTLICEQYYGVAIPDTVGFGQWTIAMSSYLFGDPNDDPDKRRIGVAGGERVREVVDNSIRSAKEARANGEDVLARLIRMQATKAEGLTDEVIRTYLIGMITGFVPTNTVAAGHMLEMLLRRPDFMARTRAAALAGDDDLLKRCLFEAMRFMPLNPGPFRICHQDYTIASGTPRAKSISAGTKMWVGTQSAMFDQRQVANPHRFNPDRPRSDYMLFGHGLHWCVGAYIAEAQITQTFKALLKKEGLRRAEGRAGTLQCYGLIPAHLVVEFDR